MISLIFRSPINTTTVAFDCAARATSPDISPFFVVPVTTQKLSLMPLAVTGIFKLAGTAKALLIPGTTAVVTPWASAYSISSEPLPKTKRSEEHTSELQSPCNIVCRHLLDKKNYRYRHNRT